MYLNLVFAVESPVDLWSELRMALLESPEFGDALRSASMCISTGADGWNDYRLLYHFDPDVTLDAVAR